MRVELALSLAGHDKGHYYVVVGEEAEAVYVADGELKLLARPKSMLKSKNTLNLHRTE